MIDLNKISELQEIQQAGDLQEACRYILLGATTRYASQSKGVGHSYELVVQEYDRLYRRRDTNSVRRLTAIVDGVKDAAKEIATHLERPGDVTATAIDMVDRWAAFVGLTRGLNGAVESEARRIFEACSEYAATSQRIFLTAAEAVSSAFDDDIGKG